MRNGRVAGPSADSPVVVVTVPMTVPASTTSPTPRARRAVRHVRGNEAEEVERRTVLRLVGLQIDAHLQQRHAGTQLAADAGHQAVDGAATHLRADLRQGPAKESSGRHHRQAVGQRLEQQCGEFIQCDLLGARPAAKTVRVQQRAALLRQGPVKVQHEAARAL